MGKHSGLGKLLGKLEAAARTAKTADKGAGKEEEEDAKKRIEKVNGKKSKALLLKKIAQAQVPTT